MVEHILLVDFHHKYGPRIEYIYPSLNNNLSQSWEEIPFICLPDGSHKVSEGFVYFRLSDREPTTIYGVASFRQIDVKDLLYIPEDVTRNYVQKSVCLLSKKPLYGYLTEKLKTVSFALFQQKDFSSIGLLKDCYKEINSEVISDSLECLESRVYEGLSFRHLVKTLKDKLLVLFKLLLLQKRIFCTSSSTRDLSLSIVSLVSLLPGTF
ncbi:late secretory pathway protein AVL9 homolog [Zophobas morio]|uniref:late secretory pathway protein AVL9 homolog n=1 Tax=Zophobas morio TaxID=2755281 RepID=UPI003082FA48